MATHYVVRWIEPNGKKHNSYMGVTLTEAEALTLLRQDEAYFYSDIKIELVKVTEEVIETRTGSHRRKA